MHNPTNTPADLTRYIGASVYTISGELATITRANYMGKDVQLYGVFTTGRLRDSINVAGEPNEFLLALDLDEWLHLQATPA